VRIKRRDDSNSEWVWPGLGRLGGISCSSPLLSSEERCWDRMGWDGMSGLLATGGQSEVVGAWLLNLAVSGDETIGLSRRIRPRQSRAGLRNEELGMGSDGIISGNGIERFLVLFFCFYCFYCCCFLFAPCFSPDSR